MRIKLDPTVKRETTSIKIDPTVWKEAKKDAIDRRCRFVTISRDCIKDVVRR
ncbi:hypothetical protein DYY67_1747 [Candidatus Nitrosotalea sp. TS]|nr:hypothetical protein [Candidatus Nitrosotalea sp. TS]